MLTPAKDSVTRTSPSPLNQLKLDVSPPLKAEYPSFSGRTNEDEGERARRKVSFKRNAKTPSTLTGNSFVLPRGSQMGEGKTEESVILTNMTTETQCNEEGSILKTLHNNYKKHLQSRSVQKERLVNASVIVTKNEERLREKLREDYLERERRWLEKKQKLLQPKKEYNVRRLEKKIIKCLKENR